MKKINKRDLIIIVAEEAGLSKKDCEAAFDYLFENIEKALIDGNEVNISNFGILYPKIKEERIGTHPKSHKKIIIPRKCSILFRPSKNLKEKLN